MWFELDSKPQTRAKLRILADYLRPWATIIKDHFPAAYYVDGFAGAGTYRYGGVEVLGSPGIAARVAQRATSAAQAKGQDFELRCRLVEADDGTCRSLKVAVAEFRQLCIVVRCARFADVADEIIGEIRSEKPRTGAAAFFFVDPFGIKGLPLRVLHDILSVPNTEALINVSIPSIRRHIGQAINLPPSDSQRQEAEATLTTVLGGDAWRQAWQGTLPASRERALVALYKDSLRARFVQEHRMLRGPNGVLMYYLVHATNNETGAKIMSDLFEREQEAGTLFAPAGIEGLKARIVERHRGSVTHTEEVVAAFGEERPVRVRRALADLVVDGWAAAPAWGLEDDEEYTFFDRRL